MTTEKLILPDADDADSWRALSADLQNKLERGKERINSLKRERGELALALLADDPEAKKRALAIDKAVNDLSDKIAIFAEAIDHSKKGCTAAIALQQATADAERAAKLTAAADRREAVCLQLQTDISAFVESLAEYYHLGDFDALGVQSHPSRLQFRVVGALHAAVRNIDIRQGHGGHFTRAILGKDKVFDRAWSSSQIAPVLPDESVVLARALAANLTSHNTARSA